MEGNYFDNQKFRETENELNFLRLENKSLEQALVKYKAYHELDESDEVQVDKSEQVQRLIMYVTTSLIPALMLQWCCVLILISGKSESDILAGFLLTSGMSFFFWIGFSIRLSQFVSPEKEVMPHPWDWLG